MQSSTAEKQKQAHLGFLAAIYLHVLRDRRLLVIDNSKDPVKIKLISATKRREKRVSSFSLKPKPGIDFSRFWAPLSKRDQRVYRSNSYGATNDRANATRSTEHA